MTQFDYQRPLTTARRLIDRYGRTVALQGVVAGPADPNNPLAGPPPPPAPVEGIRAAFIEPSGLRALGAQSSLAALFADCENVAIIAPMAGYENFDNMKFLIDNNVKWKIHVIDTLKPGDVTLLHYIGIRRP